MEQQKFTAILRTDDISGRTFTGHAAVWGQVARIGSHYEQIARSAFDSAIEREDDACLTRDHDATRLLARTSSGTLRLSTDDTGLRVEADIADTSDGRDTLTLLERGDLNAMSFFALAEVGSGTWDVAPDGRQRHTLSDFARLVDVAVVTRAAYPGTDAVLRSVDFNNLPRLTGKDQLVRVRARQIQRSNP